MNATDFDDYILDAVARPPTERHERLAALHQSVHRSYRNSLDRITAEEAARPLPSGADPRPVAQVIGHIAAWERFALLAAGDILAGIRRPRMMSGFDSYQETDGSVHSFTTIDAFNAYHLEKFSSWSWDRMRAFAGDMAASVFTMFTHPQLLHAGRLENTDPARARLSNGEIITFTMGWGLWLIMLEHPAVEHGAILDVFGDGVGLSHAG